MGKLKRELKELMEKGTGKEVKTATKEQIKKIKEMIKINQKKVPNKQ